MMLSRTSPYVKSYDGQTELINFFIKDDDLLEKYNTIWDKTSSDIEKKLDNEPVYNNFLFFFENQNKILR